MKRYVCFLSFAALALLVGCASRRADLTIGQASVCEIHKVMMVRMTVPILYGLKDMDTDFELRYGENPNAFPHARPYVFGGICVAPLDTHCAVIYICPECKKVAFGSDANHRPKQ